MIVYSVQVDDGEYGTQFFGPWLDEWSAAAWAEEHHVNCRRSVIRWQMLNPDRRECFRPVPSAGDAKPPCGVGNVDQTVRALVEGHNGNHYDGIGYWAGIDRRPTGDGFDRNAEHNEALVDHIMQRASEACNVPPGQTHPTCNDCFEAGRTHERTQRSETPLIGRMRALLEHMVMADGNDDPIAWIDEASKILAAEQATETGSNAPPKPPPPDFSRPTLSADGTDEDG